MNPTAVLMKNLGDAIRMFPEANWQDALSHGQLSSKVWLIDELAKLDRPLGTVFVLAGWLGTLPALMLRDTRLRLDKIRMFDLDDYAVQASERLNRDAIIDGWRYKASFDNVFKLDYDENCAFTTHLDNGYSLPLHDVPDTIINTSCDHIHPFVDFYALIPAGKLVVMQNNDFTEADATHTNTVRSLAEFRDQTPMQETLFEGVLALNGYNRFMRIGVR